MRVLAEREGGEKGDWQIMSAHESFVVSIILGKKIAHRKDGQLLSLLSEHNEGGFLSREREYGALILPKALASKVERDLGRLASGEIEHEAIKPATVDLFRSTLEASKSELSRSEPPEGLDLGTNAEIIIFEQPQAIRSMAA